MPSTPHCRPTNSGAGPLSRPQTAALGLCVPHGPDPLSVCRRAAAYEVTTDGNLLPRTKVSTARLPPRASQGIAPAWHELMWAASLQVVVLGSGWGSGTFVKNLAKRVTGSAPPPTPQPHLLRPLTRCFALTKAPKGLSCTHAQLTARQGHARPSK